MIARILAPLLLALALAIAPSVSAQDGDLSAGWSRMADRAETVLANDFATPADLEALRAQLVSWRERFAAAEQQNAARIASLRAEIAALGPVPEEGATEAPDLAERRAELQEQLDELLAPVRAAEAAFAAADGLIAETDALIEDRRAEALFRQEAPPVNPTLWAPALLSAASWFSALGNELSEPFDTPESRDELRAKGVQFGFLIFAATLLIARSNRLVGYLRDPLIQREAVSPLARLGLLGLSLVRLALPVLGFAALSIIVVLTGAKGPRVEAAIWLLPVMGLIVLTGRWLGVHAFPPRRDTATLLPIAHGRRREGRLHAVSLGGLLALSLLVEVMSETGGLETAFRGVLTFAIAILGGLELVRLGQLLLVEGRAAAKGDDSFTLWTGLMRLLGRVLMAIGVVGPVVIGLGYVNLGLALLWPTVLSLALLVAIGTLQSMIFDAYAALTRRTETAREALAPTLLGFGLALASVPVFALIWGVRPQVLAEWWATFLRGIPIGETRLSPSVFVTFAVIFAVGWLLTRLVKGVLRTSVLPKTRLDTGGTNAILSVTGYVGILLAALLAITTAGIDLSGLAIVAGALSVGVGFGLQTIVQNFVSGIILLIERPIKLGDWINVNGQEGFVRNISVRSTRIETFDRQDVIVPNADLISGVVTNYTLGNSSGRVLVPVGVAYGTDTRRVEAILREITEAHPMVVLNPPPVITFEGFGADSLNFLIRAVLRDVLWKVIVNSELNHAIAERFRDEGIEIPFAQRDVWLRNPEALRAPQQEAS